MLVNFLLAYYGKDFDQCGWKPRELYMVLMVFFRRGWLRVRTGQTAFFAMTRSSKSGRDGRVNLVTRDHQKFGCFSHTRRGLA